jgi:hypothetical protein
MDMYFFPPCSEKINTHTHARTHARKHARTHARTHASTHARTHARTQARTHTRKHARTHASTQAQERNTEGSALNGKPYGLGSYLHPPVLFNTGSSFSRRLQQPRPVSAQHPIKKPPNPHANTSVHRPRRPSTPGAWRGGRAEGGACLHFGGGRSKKKPRGRRGVFFKIEGIS